MSRSAKGWLCWAAYVLEAQARPHGVRLELGPRMDFRIRDSRETALSVKRMLERVDDGAGAAALLFRFYVNEASWWTFQEREQRIIAKAARANARELRQEGVRPRGGGRVGLSACPPRLKCRGQQGRIKPDAVEEGELS